MILKVTILLLLLHPVWIRDEPLPLACHPVLGILTCSEIRKVEDLITSLL